MGAPIHLRQLLHPTTGQEVVSLGYGASPEYPGFQHSKPWLKFLNLDAPNYEVLRVSKQVRDEALEAAWKGSWKHFRGVDELYQVARLANPIITVAWLNRLELDFTDTDYAFLFGLEIEPVLTQNTLVGTQVFSAMPQLQELSLRFRNPYRSADDNPWTSYYKDKQSRNRAVSHWDSWDDPVEDHRVTSHDSMLWNTNPYPCRKGFVDLLMTFAFPHIKHVKKVYLTGDVKTESKRKWEYLLSFEYVHRRGKVPARWHEEEMERLLSAETKPEELPGGPCECPLSCDITKLPPPWNIYPKCSSEDSSFDHDDAFTWEELERRQKLPKDHPYRLKFFHRYADEEIEQAILDAELWDVVEGEATRERMIEAAISGYCKTNLGMSPYTHPFHGVSDDEDTLEYALNCPWSCWLFTGTEGRMFDLRDEYSKVMNERRTYPVWKTHTGFGRSQTPQFGYEEDREFLGPALVKFDMGSRMAFGSSLA